MKRTCKPWSTLTTWSLIIIQHCFPLRKRPSLHGRCFEAQAGLKIAADLVSRGSTAPKRFVKQFQEFKGDIPKIMISREKQEDELTDYDIMVAMSSTNPDLRALVEFWAEDTKFCWDGVAARAEWIALKEISLGKVKIHKAAIRRRCHWIWCRLHDVKDQRSVSKLRTLRV